MTRIYQSPSAATGLRVLVVGAGAYPHAKGPGFTPALSDLTSVAPSVQLFLQRLLVNWRTDLAMDLLSVDLLLSDPAQPAGAVWPGFGVPGELGVGQSVGDASLANLDKALTAVLKGAGAQDGLLVLFCGHGFSRGDRYFVLSDFGEAANPWKSVVDLAGLTLALRQAPPRTQWLFWDCCADIPEAILNTLNAVGDTILPPDAARIAGAEATFGPLSRFVVASSTIGQQAFAVAGNPSRFVEMLVEGLEGAGAIRRTGGAWWVDDRGLREALTTYARRHPDLPDPEFYSFVMPIAADALDRMPFRKLAGPPQSILIAASTPQRGALKQAHIRIVQEGADPGDPAIFQRLEPGATAVLRVAIPALKDYTVTATFDPGGVPRTQSVTCFADLPLAEDVEFTSS